MVKFDKHLWNVNAQISKIYAITTPAQQVCKCANFSESLRGANEIG